MSNLKQHMGNFVYKIKDISTKVKKILNSVISENQYVIDNPRKKHNSCLIFKIDFEKAFQSAVEGVPDTTSILVNGNPTKKFPLHRELRQRDPLFFLVALEGLIGIMRSTTTKSSLRVQY
ncbi:hypothetical protein CR513_41233, partial [Mucuna pruriens]